MSTKTTKEGTANQFSPNVKGVKTASQKTKVLGTKIDGTSSNKSPSIKKAGQYSRVSKGPMQAIGSFGKRVVRGVEKVGGLLGGMAQAEVRNFIGKDKFTQSK